MMHIKDNPSYEGWNQDLQLKLKLYLIGIMVFVAIFYYIGLGI